MHSKISKLLTEKKEYEKKLKEMAKTYPQQENTRKSEQVELNLKNQFISKVIPEVMVNIY
jgi:hypothetical protein